ncbi:MAG: GNAT family N-acetyltransferase [Clostridia bacterium]|jgi:GNAT superfamily N-acetyltransferase|nr:GNAT family N-acetyltransferase [Clostridia bacterium]MBO4795640.1 GNAT family N-acetyltransferase [Clostridia bacterium]MBR5032033.1 GNAT family N-acetyltransferase [Clostridia bacterium]
MRRGGTGPGRGKAYRLEEFEFVTLRERPGLIRAAAGWFHSKWGVPEEAYYECMSEYLAHVTEYGWYLCLLGGRIVGGLGVIENDFHERKDCFPNVCAVYTEEAFRGRGIAGRLLDTAAEDMKSKGITPLYLVTDRTGFYERYGWEYFCAVRCDGEDRLSRMYIHR